MASGHGSFSQALRGAIVVCRTVNSAQPAVERTVDITNFKVTWDLKDPTLPNWMRQYREFFFDAAARAWGDVIRGWPGGAIKLPNGTKFETLKISVRAGIVDREAGRNVAGADPDPEVLKRLATGAGKAEGLPYEGVIVLDETDLERMQINQALFKDTIIHEVGHVLGLGTIWQSKGGLAVLVDGEKGHFLGETAREEYGRLLGIRSKVEGVPITGMESAPLRQERGGVSTAKWGAHWDEEADPRFKFEIMSSTTDAAVLNPDGTVTANVISRVTVGALKDLGYLVNMQGAGTLRPHPN